MTEHFRNLLLSAVLTTGAASSALAAGLEVSVEGVRSDQGDLWIMLYRGPEGFAKQSPETAAVMVKLPAREGSLVVTLHDLVPGDYAAAALHDENRNGQLDEAGGMPIEGYGFTRDAGRDAAPIFEQASIRLPEIQSTRIALTYLQP